MPGSYETFYRMMAATVRGNGPAPVPAEQARDVIRVLEHAVSSSRDGLVAYR
jgi:scyllo-inositol 2-dehydrogenase (NADP+)